MLLVVLCLLQGCHILFSMIHILQECIPVGCVPPAAVAMGGLGPDPPQFTPGCVPGPDPPQFPLGCGPGPDPPQFPPWVWAWT